MPSWFNRLTGRSSRHKYPLIYEPPTAQQLAHYQQQQQYTQAWVRDPYASRDGGRSRHEHSSSRRAQPILRTGYAGHREPASRHQSHAAQPQSGHLAVADPRYHASSSRRQPEQYGGYHHSSSRRQPEQYGRSSRRQPEQYGNYQYSSSSRRQPEQHQYADYSRSSSRRPCEEIPQYGRDGYYGNSFATRGNGMSSNFRNGGFSTWEHY